MPEVVPRLIQAGFDVVVESGAGRHTFASDQAYTDVGAQVRDGDVLADADVVLSVQPLTVDQIDRLHAGAVTISFLPVAASLDQVRRLTAKKITAFSIELLPRISRAQSMDALTSQALVAGYRAVLVAAQNLPTFFPMFMTAAGTIAPARVLVLGAGVAGLQAIATARRLGAVVDAYDVRPASADEVRSMGATFITLELESLEGSGGYAREMTEDRAQRQRELLTPYLAKADAVITTAAVPGRRAPLLVTTAMVEAMKPGTVVVDLAAETGGNCELSKPGELVRHGDVVIWGGQNVPSSMPVDASRLYSKNLLNLLMLMVADSALKLDFDDEIIAGCCVTHDGTVRHAPTAELLGEVTS